MARRRSGQLTLWDARRQTDYAARVAQHGTLLERFALWIEANPHLPGLAAEVALTQKRRGYTSGRIGYVWDILLYVYGVKAPSETHANDPETPVVVALNNDYRAPMARLLMDRYPELKGWFRVRRSQADASGGWAA